MLFLLGTKSPRRAPEVDAPAIVPLGQKSERPFIVARVDEDAFGTSGGDGAGAAMGIDPSPQASGPDESSPKRYFAREPGN